MSFVLLGILNSQAAGGAIVGSMDHLGTVEPTSDVLNVTFSNLNTVAADYQHLLILSVMDTTSGGGDEMKVRFNGDATVNYNYTSIRDSGNLTTADQGGNDGIRVWSLDGRNYMTSWYGLIPNFSNTNTRKTLYHSGGGYEYVENGGGTWKNTSAITSVTLFCNNYFTNQGNVFMLYGLKAA